MHVRYRCKKNNDKLIITWQLSKTEIQISDIREVYSDDTYAGETNDAVRIGTPYGTTDRVVIKTTSITYILFTTNGLSILNKIRSFLN